MTMLESTPGQRIRNCRKNLKYSQQELANRCNISKTAVCEIEKGVIKSPSVYVAMKLAKALQCKLEDLF